MQGDEKVAVTEMEDFSFPRGLGAFLTWCQAPVGASSLRPPGVLEPARQRGIRYLSQAYPNKHGSFTALCYCDEKARSSQLPIHNLTHPPKKGGDKSKFIHFTQF